MRLQAPVNRPTDRPTNRPTDRHKTKNDPWCMKRISVVKFFDLENKNFLDLQNENKASLQLSVVLGSNTSRFVANICPFLL